MQAYLSAYKQLWRERNGVVPNTLALFYGIFGHILAIFLLLQSSWVSLLAGTILAAHSLVICAYLVHEAAHMTLLSAKKHNEIMGEILLWLVGAAYASFSRVRHMHIRHHQDHADVSCFDYQVFLKRMPRWFQKTVYALEWAYIPAVELIMHYQVIVRPFIESNLAQYRVRVILVAISRLVFFVLLYKVSPWALLAYAIAYLLMMQALFLADAFAHTYDAYFVDRADEPVPENQRDREYDVAHTYSNLLSKKHAWLNLWNLNFGYHTAHHERASVAWHDLPEFHRELYGEGENEQVLPYGELMHTLHRNRLARVMVDDYGEVGSGPHRADGFVGAHGVSFLSIV